MSCNILYRGPAERGQCWQQLFSQALPQVNWHNWPDVSDKLAIDMMVCWIPPKQYQSEYPNLKVIFSVGAGVDQLDLASVPMGVSVVRMLDPGISQGMTEFVSLSVLSIHRNLLAYINMNQQSRWQQLPQLSTDKRTVGIMGMGNLGQSAAIGLRQLGFRVIGWSKTPKSLADIPCFDGDKGLVPFLQQTHILVCLLPLTDDTRGILNQQTLGLLPHGASLINVGRGEHLVEQDLLHLLEQEHLQYAILDVFANEPLPADNPLWQHANVLVTPHTAAITQNESAGKVLVDNVQRYLSEQAMLGLVDRRLGY